MGSRGALIVLEGCDKAGKSTQAKLLIQALIQQGKKATFMSFPDRTTTIGKMIDSYLKGTSELNDESIHLLFSANRWELVPKITKMLYEGESIVVDRYAFSGVAFSSAKGLDLTWCKNPDVGLPKPDVVFFLDIPTTEASQRGEYGHERYENVKFQTKVRDKYFDLLDDSWVVVESNREILEVHGEILKSSLAVIHQIQKLPMKKLWT